MTDQIAFIGVGNMGNPMADQLVKAGKKVKAYDVSPEMIQKAKDANLDVVDSLDDVLEGVIDKDKLVISVLVSADDIANTSVNAALFTCNTCPGACSTFPLAILTLLPVAACIVFVFNVLILYSIHHLLSL